MSGKAEEKMAAMEKNPMWRMAIAATALALHDQADDFRNGLEPSVELQDMKKALFDFKVVVWGTLEAEWWWSFRDALQHFDDKKAAREGGKDAEGK